MTCQVQFCQSCELDYFHIIGKYHGAIFPGHEKLAIDFFRQHKVLPLSVECPKCNSNLVFRPDKHQWYCNSSVRVPKTKRRRRCGYVVSDFKGSFLDETHLPPWKVLLFVNHWVRKIWDHHTVINSLKISSATSVDWRSFCSEVTEYAFDNQEAIGGEGVIVEIDESHFGKRKFDRGRPLSNIWVFGGIERVSKASFIIPLVEPLPRERTADNLIPLIIKYIKPQSVIISDKWRAYNKLDQLGYVHKSVNHSDNFVDPEDPSVHTQNIERLWRDIKEWLKRPGNRSVYFKQYISRYLFIHKYPEDQVLHHFFLTASQLYPPQGDRQRPSRQDEEDEEDEESGEEEQL